MSGKASKSQIEKFKRAARELGADKGDEETLDKALRKMKRQPEQDDLKRDDKP